MSWEDRRTSGAVGTVVRANAHADDAKHRADETTRLPPRARWIVPVAVGAAVLLIGGGAAAVMATRGGDRPGRTTPGTAGGRTGTTSTKDADAAIPGLGDDGSLTGTLTITGTGHGIVKPYLGAPGQAGSGPATRVFLCTPARCINKSVREEVLTKVGPGSYGLTRQHAENSPHGPLIYTETVTLKVVGTAGTYSTASTGVFAGKPPHDYSAHPPQVYTLSGPVSFS